MITKHQQILTLIHEIKFEKEYIEEFDAFNMGGFFKTLSSLIPGVGTYHTYQCLKRTNLKFISKLIHMVGSLPFGLMAYTSCIIRSAGEGVLASKMDKTLILIEDLIATLQIDRVLTSEYNAILLDYANPFIERARLLKIKYPVFNKELENNIIIDYGQLSLDYTQGYIQLISKLTTRKLNEDQLSKLNEIKTEFNARKLEFDIFKKSIN